MAAAAAVVIVINHAVYTAY